MKMAIMNTLVKNVFLSGLTVMMFFLFDSCATKIPFESSSVVPAARGSVKVKKDNNHNYVIQLHLTNLAEVKRLEPARQTYVVWMETGQNIAKNVGQIKSSSSMLSQTLKASFETVSSSRPTKIFITAEDDASIQYPGTQLVLSTDNF